MPGPNWNSFAFSSPLRQGGGEWVKPGLSLYLFLNEASLNLNHITSSFRKLAAFWPGDTILARSLRWSHPSVPPLLCLVCADGNLSARSAWRTAWPLKAFWGMRVQKCAHVNEEPPYTAFPRSSWISILLVTCPAPWPQEMLSCVSVRWHDSLQGRETADL